ncbi:MAG TPA: hypothetical protein VF511_03930 [Chthoniobacterales bacterium]
MKPTLQFIETECRDDSRLTNRPAPKQPKTDCNFQPGSLRDFSGGGGGKRFPSIRGISEEYFEKEARTHFASEAAFFALIVVTVAVPLFEVVRGLVDWVL